MKLFKKKESTPAVEPTPAVDTTVVEDEEVIVTIPAHEETPPVTQDPAEPAVTEEEDNVAVTDEEEVVVEEPTAEPEVETISFTSEEIKLVKEILPKLVALLSGEAEIEIIDDVEEEEVDEEEFDDEVDELEGEVVVEEQSEEDFEEEFDDDEEEEPVVEDSDELVVDTKTKKTKTADFSPFAEDGSPKGKHAVKDSNIQTKPFGSRWVNGK